MIKSLTSEYAFYRVITSTRISGLRSSMAIHWDFNDSLFYENANTILD